MFRVTPSDGTLNFNLIKPGQDSSASRGYRCDCADGFEGENCGSSVDDCASNPCQNGGLCVDGFKSYECACTEGFEGVHCQMVGTSDLFDI